MRSRGFFRDTVILIFQQLLLSSPPILIQVREKKHPGTQRTREGVSGLYRPPPSLLKRQLGGSHGLTPNRLSLSADLTNVTRQSRLRVRSYVGGRVPPGPPPQPLVGTQSCAMRPTSVQRWAGDGAPGTSICPLNSLGVVVP